MNPWIWYALRFLTAWVSLVGLFLVDPNIEDTSFLDGRQLSLENMGSFVITKKSSKFLGYKKKPKFCTNSKFESFIYESFKKKYQKFLLIVKSMIFLSSKLRGTQD
jgi:hypothetical protein